LFASDDAHAPSPPSRSVGPAEAGPNAAIAEEQIHMATNIVVLQPLGALIAGILILIMPRLLNYIVAIYLILIGLIGVAPHLMR
jgi:hypothetical protein